MPMILQKHKKKGREGFKNFVFNLETMDEDKRQSVIQGALLEDPVYMRWIMQNIISFDYLLKLNQDELELIAQEIPNGTKTLIMAIKETQYETTIKSTLLNERMLKAYEEEYEYTSPEAPRVQKTCQVKYLSTMRKLQENRSIRPFDWKFPEENVTNGSHIETPSKGDFELKFEDDQPALTGTFENKLREGNWKHYYPNGKIMAEGIYVEGNKEGHWYFHFADGSIKSEGEYKSDLKEGEWLVYDKMGNKSTVKYQRGKKS